MRSIGTRLELLVDDWLIESLRGATLKLHRPIPRNIAVPFDKPWEGPISFYVTVFKDDDCFRCYYRGENAEGGEPAVTAYAESPDGIGWHKPQLGLHTWRESSANNIIWTGEGTHNFTPFRDSNPGCPPAQRYKALAGCTWEQPQKNDDWRSAQALRAFVSPDALHWQPLRPEPVITEGAFDSQNLAFWDTVQQQYVAYVRDFRDGCRTIRRCTSPDFVHWTTPEWLDFGDSPLEHFYTNATTPYFRAPHIYLQFPKRYVPKRKVIASHPADGVSDGVFLSSRDGLHWDRRFMEGFILAGPDPENWTERCNAPAWGVVQTSPTELSIYWVEHYRHPTCRLRRGALRLDGFVSVNAPYGGGELLTKPFLFNGRALVLNYSTSAAGSVRVEVQDEHRRPLPGFALEQCPYIYGDQIDRIVEWETGSDLSGLVGTPIRLRIALKDADLYAIRFSE